MTQDNLVGRTVAGRYRVDQRIGVGGMGVVYQAYQEAMARPIALKVLASGMADDEVTVRRFEQEARAASRLRHPNTITLHDFGRTEDGILYIAMELLEGITLRQEVKRCGHLDSARAVRIVSQISASLDEAHQAGIVHRDLKPDNIFLCDLGGTPDFVKVLDFGVAKFRRDTNDETLTEAGMVFGTPRYMSPEQAQSLPLDARSDLYALGVILFHLLAGRTPFEGESPVSILVKHVSDPVPPLVAGGGGTISPRLEELVMALLEKDPDRRPASSRELLTRLQEIALELEPATRVALPGDGFATSPINPLRDTVEAKSIPPQKGIEANRVRRPTGVPWQAFALAGAVMATLAGWWFLAQRSPPPAPAASTVKDPTTDGATTKEKSQAPDPNPKGTDITPPKEAKTSVAKKEPKKVKAAGTGTKKKRRPASAKPAATKAKEVTVTIGSIPAGAEVYDGSRFLGLTPLPITRPMSHSAQRFVLKKGGYLPTKAVAVFDRSRRSNTRLETAATGTENTTLKRTPRGPANP